MTTDNDTDGENTEEYEYTGTGLHRDDEYVEPGVVVVPTDAELRAFGDSFERLPGSTDASTTTETGGEPEQSESDGEDGDGGADDGAAEPFEGYDDYTVPDIEEVVGNVSTDVLYAMDDYEGANKDRDGASDAIQDELDARDEHDDGGD